MPALSGAAAQLLDGEDERRGRGDVAQIDHPGPGRHAGPDAFREFVGPERQGNLHGHVPGARVPAYEVPGVVAGAILVVRGENLVPGPQGDGARHGVHAVGGIGEVDQVFGLRAQVLGQHRTRMRQQFRRAAAQERHGVPFHFPLPPVATLQHFRRTGSEGTVIQEDKRRVEQEQILHEQLARGYVGNPLSASRGNRHDQLTVAPGNRDGPAKCRGGRSQS